MNINSNGRQKKYCWGRRGKVLFVDGGHFGVNEVGRDS